MSFSHSLCRKPTSMMPAIWQVHTLTKRRKYTPCTTYFSHTPIYEHLVFLSLSLSLSYLISYTNTWMDIHCMNLTDKLSFYIPQMIYIGRYISSTRHDKLTTHVSTFAHSIYLYLIKSMYLLQTLNVSAPHTQCMSHTHSVCLPRMHPHIFLFFSISP